MIKSFTAPKSTLCIVITSAFRSMGVNCQRVRTVLSFGAPKDVKGYIQQTGRVGRNGLSPKAALLWSADSCYIIIIVLLLTNKVCKTIINISLWYMTVYPFLQIRIIIIYNVGCYELFLTGNVIKNKMLFAFLQPASNE